LNKLKINKNIKKVVVVNLTDHGDPIYAGITQLDLINAVPLIQHQQDRNKGEGHFYYAHATAESPARWASLAKKMFDEGLR
jgi:hypothetical protein